MIVAAVLSVIETDALNHATTRRINTLGQAVQMVDAAGSDTEFEYDAFGNLLKTRDFYGNEVAMTYSNRGLRLTSNDPDMGQWSFDYFPFGELKSRTDAKNQIASFTYDTLSRMLTRTEPEGTTTFVYDTQANGVGQLASVSSPGGYQESFTYDNRGRVLNHNTLIDGVTYIYIRTYNALTGQLQALAYPASFGTTFKAQYDYSYGQLARIRDFNQPATIFWQATATNAQHQVIDYQLGNGVIVNRTYDRISGLLDRIDTGYGGTSAQQQLVYQWNKTGSLLRRSDLNQGSLNESFAYDALDRLDTVQRNGVQTLNVDYDAIGNITNKTGVGAYVYHATKKHAVASAGANAYSYDANGNMTLRNGQSTSWYSYNMPYQINDSSGVYAKFWYGADRARYKQEHHSYEPDPAAPLRTTLYVQKLFEKTRENVGGGLFQSFFRHYIVANGERVATVLRTSLDMGGPILQSSNRVIYAASDHLGSLDSEYLENSAFGRYSFSAFGERRDLDWDGAAVPSLQPWETSSNRGFTAHEHLDNIDGLIHMNGRVYDPVVARFMSPDPFVQAPFSGQGLNRYSYAFNNPLSYTDPSGYSADGFFGDFFGGFGNLWGLGSFFGWGGGNNGCTPWCPGGRVPPRGPVTPDDPAPEPRYTPAPPPTLPPADTSVRGLGRIPIPDNNSANQAPARTINMLLEMAEHVIAVIQTRAYGGRTLANDLEIIALGASLVTGGESVAVTRTVSRAVTRGVRAAAAPGAAVPAVARPVVSAREIIEATARQEWAKGTTHLLSKLSPGERAAYLADPVNGSRFLGTAVHRATDDALAVSHPGRFGYNDNGAGMDFVDQATGELIELTTGGQSLTKIPKYRLPDLDQVAIYP